MDAYRNAIMQNKECFKGKAVLDVGSGSGVLAIWAAMAGARVVYAVEATSMAKQARRLAEANGVGHIVQVFEGYMEQIELPEQVDIIISEWMGYFLLRESMLDPVINARLRWLKPGGACYPSHATLFLSPIRSSLYLPKLQEYENEIAGWTSFKDFMQEDNHLNIGCLDSDWKKEQTDYLLHSCLWQQMDPAELLGPPATLIEFEVGAVTQADVSTFTTPFRMDIGLDSEVIMICLPPQGTPPPQHSSRHGPQRTQHTASTAATPRYPQGRRQYPCRRAGPTQTLHARPFRRYLASCLGSRRPSTARPPRRPARPSCSPPSRRATRTGGSRSCCSTRPRWRSTATCSTATSHSAGRRRTTGCSGSA